MRGVVTILLLCAAAEAATINTTLTVNVTGAIGATGVTATGTAGLTNGIGSGTFSGSLSLLTYSGPFTITIGSSTITGTLTVPVSILTTGSGSGSATITGGTGTFAGATGSFPNLAGTGSVGATGGLVLTFNGAGTISTGGTVGPAPPAITELLNNYGLIPPGFPNYGIAPGALFIVKGTGLADPAAQPVLQSAAAPGIPKTLNGASVSVTVNGATVTPGIYYAIASQIAAVLPAGTPTGTGTITVSYNGTPSASFPIQVTPAALGIGTYNGLAIATNPTTGALYTYTNSVQPGDIIVLWGAGLGAIPADSDTVFTPAPHAAGGTLQIYIGGIQATVLYAGDSGYPGVNQIDVMVPSNVPPGCNVTLVGVTGSGSNLTPSNTTALAIGSGVCADPAFGTNGTALTLLNSQNTVRTGFLGLLHAVGPSGTSDIAEAVFDKVTGAFYTSGSYMPSLGSCSLSQVLTAANTTATVAALNFGTVTIAGPAGTATLNAEPVAGVGVSAAVLPAGFIPSSGGTFTFAATGGADVGSFTATVSFPNPLLTWTNQSAAATINRSAGATITWTGGGSGSYVEISGNSTNATAGTTGSFVCFAPVSAGQFTVPNFVLLSLPAGAGSISLSDLNFPGAASNGIGSFTATGLDYGFAEAFTSISANSTYN